MKRVFLTRDFLTQAFFPTRVLLPALAAGVLLLPACSQPPEAAPPRPVKLLTVGSVSAGPRVELAGEVRARVESRLGFRVGGKLVERPVEVGQRVVAGQVLARLDPRDFQLARQAAASQLEAAKQEVARARADMARLESLRRQGYVSAAEIDRTRVALAAAEAAREQAGSLSSLEDNRLGDATLRADVDGVIVGVLADVGEVVSPGMPVLVLARDGAREIAVEFPEDRAPLAKAAKAQAFLWANPAERFPATLRELAAAADPVTRTFRARYSVQAPAGAFALGQSATLVLDVPADPRLASAGVVRLPTTALMGAQGASLVWVYDPKASVVRRTPVKVAGMDGNDILVAGLPDGAQVVVAGTHTLTEGQAVRPLAPATH